MAFFADAQGRITRFSREPKDLATARRLNGQAALPGLVDAHAHGWQRVLRGRTEIQGRADASAWTAGLQVAAEKLSDEDIFDCARMVFLEMLYAGITCVGEFHFLHHRPDGSPYPDRVQVARELLRAAHDVGIRLALLNVAYARGDFRGDGEDAPPRFRTADIDQFIRDTEVLRIDVEKSFPADEVWLGTGIHSVAQASAEQIKALATYARAQRFRFHAHVSTTAAENAACSAEFGRTPVAMLAELGVVDKRFTAVDALHLSDDDLKILGNARAMVCACPIATQNLGLAATPADKVLAGGAALSFGSDTIAQLIM